MSTDSQVLHIQHDGWAEIVLNQPATRNALTGPLGRELVIALEAVAEDDSTRLFMLRGAEGSFCSGLNLKEFNREPPPPWLKDWGATWREVHQHLFECRKPMVAAVERFAINGGAALAVAADLLVVGDDSFVQVGEVRQGMSAPYNLAWLHLRYSETVISQLTLTGKRFTGEELHRLGIAYAAPPTSEVLTTATQLCEELATFPSGGLRGIKGISQAYRPDSAKDWFDTATKNTTGRRGKIPKVN